MRRSHAGRWTAASFGALGIVELLGRLLPSHPHGFWEVAGQKVEIVVLLLFPYLLYRFTIAFIPPSERVTRFVSAMTVLLALATLVLPRFPAEGEPRPLWFLAYLAAFLFHWTVLSVIVALRLWRAGRGQPTVARRRMRLLAGAAAALTVALFFAAASARADSVFAATTAILGFVSAIVFILALAPPRLVRLSWRRPEQERLQRAIAGLVTLARTQAEIAERVLPPMADIVGAQAILLRNADGEIIGMHNVSESRRAAIETGEPPDDDEDSSEVLQLDVPGGSLVVWTTPYAPFFGGDELELLRTLAALTGIALDRARLFAQEVEARKVLEHADELKANFISLAAHELRTPVAAIAGFARTLTERADDLNETRVRQIHTILEQQASRLGALIEQLLDLSRLDAAAVPISKAEFNVRERAEEVIQAIPAAGDGKVDLDVPLQLETFADPNVFERVLTNLVTNALRYGEAPIVVRAEQNDRHLRVVVQDHGPGVAPEFVPDLFERFSRSKESSARASGTGLGLAIARSYARAHHGDLFYEPAKPHGSRFQLVLPVERMERA